jgi:hypothetical protein
MIRNVLVSLMVLALVLWGYGCSNKPAEPVKENLNLEDKFGGYTASPESPGFGETDLLDEAASDEEFTDKVLTSPEIDSVISDPQSRYYHIRIVWGQLCYDSSVTEVTDWTGSLSVSRGVEVIRQIIHFEPIQDSILPRTDPQVIKWVSQTTVHNDGIAVDIFVPSLQAIDTLDPEPVPVTVSFETGPYSRTFKLEELRSLDTIVYLEDSNAVAFQAFELHRYPCPRGFLAGKWGFDEEGQGRFHGVWWSQRPNLKGWFISGYLKGHFGQNSAGINVFFGKWISASGEFRGFLKGLYGHRPVWVNSQANMRRIAGWFAGRIYDADQNEIGVLGGRFRSAPRYEDGFFQGRWKLHCNTMEPDPFDGEEGF